MNSWNEFRNGSKEAFILLYKAHYKYLCAYGSRFSTDDELVEECVQQLFYELWDNREKQKEVQFVKTYLQTYLRRKIVRELAKLEKSESLHSDKFTELERERSFEEILINRQESESVKLKLEKAFNKLSPTQVELIRLRFYENLSNDEIAQLTGLSHSIIYNQISRALKIIKKQFITVTIITTLGILFLIITIMKLL
ncbi:RNA polymerase sigma factor [Solitalea canadensis]|uniref:RNA polymerase sigma factor, sigma-70 family n=1 Tax=Solitalea canadensis (strain ATCC 29591 / DSM 3403 / JCM 21819 / LMG 8368 / NBRC 15130 / NCIMB 12057 / USAM 9D) TaxID=929556 RepID=H8KQG3_SOLCM|nr:sigma-70 family RNA polymerase sigma factor [Solitalea canadensis]AFD06579.1 RNA polymerase sigma factor, sigma-70 family [Solitalea canadensis DSM 3403]